MEKTNKLVNKTAAMAYVGQKNPKQIQKSQQVSLQMSPEFTIQQ